MVSRWTNSGECLKYGLKRACLKSCLTTGFGQNRTVELRQKAKLLRGSMFLMPAKSSQSPDVRITVTLDPRKSTGSPRHTLKIPQKRLS